MVAREVTNDGGRRTAERGFFGRQEVLEGEELDGGLGLELLRRRNFQLNDTVFNRTACNYTEDINTVFFGKPFFGCRNLV